MDDWNELRESQKDTGKAMHFSDGKSGVDQIPPEMILELGKVFSAGMKKYRQI